jgi:hypothetical protein
VALLKALNDSPLNKYAPLPNKAMVALPTAVIFPPTLIFPLKLCRDRLPVILIFDENERSPDVLIFPVM